MGRGSHSVVGGDREAVGEELNMTSCRHLLLCFSDIEGGGGTITLL